MMPPTIAARIVAYAEAALSASAIVRAPYAEAEVGAAASGISMSSAIDLPTPLSDALRPDEFGTPVRRFG
jgi:hypothetical protein